MSSLLVKLLKSLFLALRGIDGFGLALCSGLGLVDLAGLAPFVATFDFADGH